MQEYLLFHLYGAMASWGGIAVGEFRGSESHPGRSALIGLLAAALGLRRDDGENQQYLAHGYRFAVRLFTAGTLLRDYHTAQVSPQAALKKYPVRTRFDELAIPKSKLVTILSNRDYRCDSYCQVAVCADESPRWTLEALKEALHMPVFALYLGRKSCPPALPLQAQCISAPNLVSAFDEAHFVVPEWLERNGGSLYWDEGMEAGIEARETFIRRDQPRNRHRWQFDERPEHHAGSPSGE